MDPFSSGTCPPYLPICPRKSVLEISVPLDTSGSPGRSLPGGPNAISGMNNNYEHRSNQFSSDNLRNSVPRTRAEGTDAPRRYGRTSRDQSLSERLPGQIAPKITVSTHI